MPRYVLRCVEEGCGTQASSPCTTECAACGGLVDAFYDVRCVEVRDSGDSIERYFDLLPLQRREGLIRIGQLGPTPCVSAPSLANAIGLRRLYLKDETGLPTGTTKDRATAVTLACYAEAGLRDFTVVSTGNAATSMAYGVGLYPQFALHIFVGERFADRVRFEADNVQLHAVPGGLEAAQRAAQGFSRETGIPQEGGFFSIPKREGLKLAYLEAIDQMPEEPAVVVQAVSSAIGIWSAHRAFQQGQAMGKIRRLPRLVCVQQESCCPMYLARREGARRIAPHHVFHEPSGIAAALLRGDPTRTYPYISAVLDATSGLVEVASEAEILAAADLVRERASIACGYAAACAVAGLRRAVDGGRVGPGEVVLVNLTGGVGR